MSTVPFSAQQCRNTYLSCFPRCSGPFADALLTWPDLFAAAFDMAPTLVELVGALDALRIEGDGEPAFADVRDRIFARRQKRAIDSHEARAPSAACSACHGTGYVQVVYTLTEHGRARLLDPGVPEAVSERHLYTMPQPCVCAAGETINREMLRWCKGGDMPVVKAYGYSRERLAPINALRILAHEVRPYLRACDGMYRQGRGMEPLPEPRRAPPNAEWDAMIDRILAQARGQAAPEPPAAGEW